jgi:hypothetical protein
VPSGQTPTANPPDSPPQRATSTLSVPLTAELRAELESIAGAYGVPLSRLAREAIAIGLRAIKARSDRYNRQAFGVGDT